MAEVRITKIICGSCEGTGECRLLAPAPCLWCKGARRLPTADALHYANTVYMLAGGGYIAGDHDLEVMRKMEAQAECIYALSGAVPPWKEPNHGR
ncbi:hypothetical protein [Aurantimonas sp. 22II-16-19i]|uniref:hypothetical protein n=1 Tax=Aurantimonas sp. 22II-16-19i TaxID=1317114 RepID=UPI0009F7E401|nr:hypothetical protein [Aurantimonas sp. 22II-16-19i]ORE90954.1 hypothetical protein ATO4_19869 [Aurantimonas sp. 22II-16-19i]